MQFLETERTVLRPFIIEDGISLFNLNQDPDVLKYTGDVPFHSLEEANNFIKQYIKTQAPGLGRWAVIHKTTDQILGWCGLKYNPDLNEYDLGFRFFKTYWGQGFATEASRACLDYGFQHLDLPAIVGRTMEQNAASICVLQKIGMHFSKCILEKGVAWQVYEIARKN
jgi:RimJ/RimL family protein N-acetyltransferase